MTPPKEGRYDSGERGARGGSVPEDYLITFEFSFDLIDRLIDEIGPRGTCRLLEPMAAQARKAARLHARTGREHGFAICMRRGADPKKLKRGDIKAGPIVAGEEYEIRIPEMKCDPPYEKIGDVHTHDESPEPSPPDIINAPIGCVVSAKTGEARCYSTEAPECWKYAKVFRELYSIRLSLLEWLLDLDKNARAGKISKEEYVEKKTRVWREIDKWEQETIRKTDEFLDRCGCRATVKLDGEA